MNLPQGRERFYQRHTKMKYWLLLMLWLTTLVPTSIRAETYTVIAPNIVRPNTDYLVAVTAHDISKDQDVQLRIRGQSDTGQTIEIRQDTTVHKDQTQIVRLRIGDLGSGSYTLTAKGTNPITFDQTQQLTYVHKGYSVFIQTDRAIYRPGNTVKFRAIVVTPQLKPSVVGSFDVAMSDGDGNIIRRWERVFTNKGVFAAELELAEAPVLGDWNITVDVSGQIFAKSFLVAEYVLPKFGVDIDLPDYGTFSQGQLTATIRATYHHGGPVKGEATVSVFPKYKSSYLQPIFSEPLRRVVDIDGKVDITFDNLAKELSLTDDYAREIVFDVHVKEDLTERIQNNTNSIVLHKYPYKIELVKTADAFKPGMPYTAFLKVANQDNSPVLDDLNQVSVKWGFSSNPDNYNVTEFVIPDNGIIELNFDTPLQADRDVLGIEATYKDLTQWFSSIPRAMSESNNYIQARLQTINPEVGQNVRIQIEASEAYDTLTYLILGRGKLVFAETLRASPELNFRATSDMSPRCRVIVYYVRAGGSAEVVADALDFEVRGALTNFVDIWANRKSQFPNSDVTINVKAKPGSFVGLMAVDKSARALKAGHDLVDTAVLDELRSYDSARLPSFYPWFRVIEPKAGSLYWYTGASASASVFGDSGAVILTNGQLTKGRGPTVSGGSGAIAGARGDNRPFGRPLPAPDAATLNPDQGPGVEYESATRPPLAGPYAFSRLPRPVDNLPKVYLRSDLPPTWLFANTTTDLDGLATLDVKTPALANSSWVISGFSLDDLHGLGISTELQQLEVFQPFFVKVDLPYAVKRGETLAVQMVVYNYLEREISAEVTLENPGGNSFVFGSRHPNEIEAAGTQLELFRTKRVSVKPGRGTLLSFIVTPVEVGLIDMKITAKSGSVGQDVQVRQLLVEAEGEAMFHNEALLLDLRSDQSQEYNFTVNIPRTAVNGSARVQVAAVVDPVGPAMNNLKQLITYPVGCGEQNMIRIVPAVILSDYLESIDRLSGSLRAEAVRLMEDGYQRQLAYKLEDGSFSPFGPVADRRGSVWVTALTARYFKLASRFIDIDNGVADAALDWLVEAQAGDGGFTETGRIVDARAQESKTALTAFVALAFLDNRFAINLAQRNAMNKAISFLAESLDVSEADPYSLSMATYALHLAEHPLRDRAFNGLNALASTDGDKRFWETQLEGFEKENPWTAMPNSANIEMTSYALLTLLLRNQFDEALPVAKWLMSQQNRNGGFASTSDTYAAVLALKEFSSKARIPERGSDIEIRYSYLQTVRSMQVRSSEPTILQKRILPPETRSIRIKATGGGFAVVQIGYEYNLNVTAAWPSFVVNPQVFKPSTANHMQVTICVNYIEGGTSRSSNMAVMEVNLPSGFTANMDALPALRRFKGVKRVDTERGDTKIILYFETMTRSELCPTISAFRTHRVANQRPASVLVYDYYDQSRRARSFYDVVPTTLCDICQGDDCPDDGCPDRPQFQTFGSYAYGENVDTASSVSRLGLSLVALLGVGLGLYA